MSIPYMELLSKARKDMGLTRRELGNTAGLEPSHLYRIEKGLRNPPKRQKVIELAKALNLGPEDINLHLRAAGYSPEFPDTREITVDSTRGVVSLATSISKEDNQSVYREALLNLLAESLDTLPAEIIGSAMATLSGFTDTLRTFGWLLLSQDAYFTDHATSLNNFKSGPIQVACIPIAGWQWQEWPFIRIIESIDRASREAISAGVTEVIVIVPAGRADFVKRQLAARPISVGAEIKCIVQDTPLGLGHAVLRAQSLIQDRPFALLLPDERFYLEGETVLERLVNGYHRQKETTSLVALAKLKATQKHYGIARIRETSKMNNVYKIEQIAEKPSCSHPIFRNKSTNMQTLHVIGRYILHPSVFSALSALEEDRKPTEQLELTDALQWLLEKGDETVCGFELSLEPVRAGRIIYFPTNETVAMSA